MTKGPEIKPLPYKKRRGTFRLLLVLFVVALPFLYLYTTGYRFDFGKEGALVSTGGIYVAAERTGASIYIDDELVRETRTFRTAFYAQSLEPKTHRVTVQKENHHTWVKELPVYPHLVTEAQAFNMPLVPQIRVISKWQTATGSAVVSEIIFASTTNPFVATSTTATSTFVLNLEYENIIELFSTTSATSTETLLDRVTESVDLLFPATTTATSTFETATTSKEWRGAKLYENEEDIYATWSGSREDMPYYYCAEPFEPYSTSTEEGSVLEKVVNIDLEASTAELLDHPVQTIPEDAVCDPTIKLDRKWQEVKYFDFFPGSTDLVILALEDGIYVVEIDNRAWQNVQPLFEGKNLDMRVEDGNVYVYDKELIYQIILDD